MKDAQPRNMRRRNLILFVVLLALTTAAVIALIEAARRTAPPSQPLASAQSFAPTDPFPRRITDAGGREVVINQPPQRIASQTVGTDEILLAICERTRIARLSPIALDELYSNIAAEARAANLAIAPNAESILSANPDLVFVASFSRAETIEVLQAAGAPVFRLGAFNSIDDIKTNIRIVGYLTGKDAAATQLINEIDADLARIAASIPPAQRSGNRLRVMSFGAGGSTAGANTLFDDIVRAAGAINITAEKGFDGFPQISAEQVAAWNPDYIIASSPPNEFMQTRTRLLTNPAIAASEAGREGRIIIIETRHLLAVSHHITKAVDALARGLYEKK
jgi:iron complex transport system substrate-binding protein